MIDGSSRTAKQGRKRTAYIVVAIVAVVAFLAMVGVAQFTSGNTNASSDGAAQGSSSSSNENTSDGSSSGHEGNATDRDTRPNSDGDVALILVLEREPDDRECRGQHQCCTHRE